MTESENRDGAWLFRAHHRPDSTLAAILVALRPGVLLNSVYAFAEIMNMQSIRESPDNEDPHLTNIISS